MSSGVEVGLQVWLKQPLVDLAEITVRHDIVETFTSDPTLRESLRDQHLRGNNDNDNDNDNDK